MLRSFLEPKRKKNSQFNMFSSLHNCFFVNWQTVQDKKLTIINMDCTRYVIIKSLLTYWSNECQPIIWRSFDNCPTFVWQLCDVRLTIVRRSFDNCPTFVWQLSDVRLTIVRRPFDHHQINVVQLKTLNFKTYTLTFVQFQFCVFSQNSTAFRKE